MLWANLSRLRDSALSRVGVGCGWLYKCASFDFARYDWMSRFVGGIMFRAAKNFLGVLIGDPDSQYDLGAAYLNDGAISLRARAIGLIHKAAEQAHPEAQAMLSVIYSQGKYCDRNVEKAVEWANKSANQGNLWGKYCLGTLYDSGLGVPKDAGNAFKCYLDAASGGLVKAQILIAKRWKDYRPEFLQKPNKVALMSLVSEYAQNISDAFCADAENGGCASAGSSKVFLEGMFFVISDVHAALALCGQPPKIRGEMLDFALESIAKSYSYKVKKIRAVMANRLSEYNHWEKKSRGRIGMPGDVIGANLFLNMKCAYEQDRFRFVDDREIPKVGALEYSPFAAVLIVVSASLHHTVLAICGDSKDFSQIASKPFVEHFNAAIAHNAEVFGRLGKSA